MPIEKDLKDAYHLLYDKKEPGKALALYDSVLKQDSNCLNANAYKSVCLEKLYFSDSSWHNPETLQAASDFLNKALAVANSRNDRAKIGFVYFRISVHNYNCMNYQLAKKNMEQCESYGYKDDTLPIWKHNIEQALKRQAKKNKSMHAAEQLAPLELNETNVATRSDSLTRSNDQESAQVKPASTLRTDWYQSSNTVTLTLFVKELPVSKDDVVVTLTNSVLSISYPLPQNGSEFQYQIELSHPVEADSVRTTVFSKKIEITMTKKTKFHWKSLEKTGTNDNDHIPSTSVTTSNSAQPTLSYPSSSKKVIDWSKIDLDSDDDESKTQSADSFFQQLYKGADEDTRRAMMKSFVESNGTSLSTNWEEVSKGKVEPALPDGVEMKKI